MLLKNVPLEIYKPLLKEGYEVYFSGPTARNIILKNPTNNYYLYTTADIITLSRLFDVEFPGQSEYDGELIIDNITARFKSFTFPADGKIFDFFRKESLSQVFTFDTFYIDLKKETIIDPWEGYYNFRKKEIIPLENFTELYKSWPHKILDAFYLISNHNFILSEEFAKKIEDRPFNIDRSRIELLRTGLNSLLTLKNPYMALNHLDRFNILTAIFPELLPCRSFSHDKDYHPEGNVYEHTLECFKHLHKPSLHLSLALILHDAGKPESAAFDGKNLRFPGHSQLGISIARKALKRLGYTADIIEKVEFLIRYHLLGHEFRKMDEKRKEQFMNNPLFPDLLKLYKADILSCYGNLTDYKKIVSLYKKIQGE